MRSHGKWWKVKSSCFSSEFYALFGWNYAGREILRIRRERERERERKVKVNSAEDREGFKLGSAWSCRNVAGEVTTVDKLWGKSDSTLDYSAAT